MLKWLVRILLVLVGLILVFSVLLHIGSVVRGNRIAENYAYLEEDLHRVNVDGVDVVGRLHGDQNNPALVLIHGFLGSSNDFRYLIEAFEDDYFVIAIDQVGYGASDKPVDFDYTKENQARVIKAFLDDLGVESYHLAGHSMGGEVVLRHAALYEEDLLSLILLAPAGLGVGGGPALPIPFYTYIFKNYYLQRLVFRSVYEDTHYARPEYFDPMYYFNQTIPPEVLRAFSLAEDETTLENIIEDLTVQTLILYGEDDTWTPVSLGEQFDALIENSTFVTIENSGHLPFVESVDEVVEALKAFLD